MRGEEEEIVEGVSTRSRPRIKHASNVGSSSKDEFVQEYKRLNWFQTNVLCMNVDIHHKKNDSYIAQKHMNDNQQALHKAFWSTHPDYVESPPSSFSSSIYSYGKWSKGFADWHAFDEVTSYPTVAASVAQGKKPMTSQDDKEDDEEFITGFDNDEEEEYDDE
jgi:hypothetical protein